MITTAPVPPAAPVASGAAVSGSEGPVTTLRGNGVDIDPRRAGRWAAATALVVATVVAVAVLVAGIQKNDQADSLRTRGVPVAVTVTSCMGLLGGSGSNQAGYACQGSYRFGGRHYVRSIPGNSVYAPGSVLRGVVASDDPGLLSTPAMVATQRSSSRVYVVPGVLLAAVVAATVLWVARRRRGGDGAPSPEAPSTTAATTPAAVSGPEARG